MKNNRESLLSIFAIIVSVFALAISTWQLIDNREHNRLSVRPFIITSTLLQGIDKKSGIYISNNGLGPGIITNFKVTANGYVFSGLGTSQWDAVLKALDIDPSCFAWGWPKQGDTVKVGEQTPVITLTSAKPQSLLCLPNIIKLVKSKDLRIRLEYESMYKEKFIYETNTQINENFTIPNG